MSDWISVEDCNGPDGALVLVYSNKTGFYTIAHWNTYKKWWQRGIEKLYWDPSHWMHLPPPPTNKFARSYTTYQESITDKRYINPRTTVGIFESEEHYQKVVAAVEEYRRLRAKQISEEGTV